MKFEVGFKDSLIWKQEMNLLLQNEQLSKETGKSGALFYYVIDDPVFNLLYLIQSFCVYLYFPCKLLLLLYLLCVI